VLNIRGSMNNLSLSLTACCLMILANINLNVNAFDPVGASCSSSWACESGCCINGTCQDLFHTAACWSLKS
ncbi:MAG TPA: hypothetical protein VJJ83_01785, partial [Candidatus Babeliales bacterium]|nr:hypothetical protein [Candidatus Babeliales bacterium]